MHHHARFWLLHQGYMRSVADLRYSHTHTHIHHPRISERAAAGRINLVSRLLFTP